MKYLLLLIFGFAARAGGQTITFNNISKDFPENSQRIVISGNCFELDKAILSPAGISVLNSIVPLLRVRGSCRMLVENHSDCRTNNYSLSFSMTQRRADSIAAYLSRQLNYTPVFFSPTGKAASELLNDCNCEKPCTPEQHAINNRTVIRIVSWNVSENPIDFKNPKPGQYIEIPMYYDLDRSGLRPECLLYLDTLCKKLGSFKPHFAYTVESHTDCRSSSMYNMDLTQRRADTIASIMNRRLQGYAVVSGKGFGESQLVNECRCEGKDKVPCTHQQNRRTVLRISGYRPWVLPLYDCCKGEFDCYKYLAHQMAEEIDSIENCSFELQVHTDCRRSAEQNLQHSQALADSFSNYIKQVLKRPDFPLTAAGKGEAELVNDCHCEGDTRAPCTEAQHQQNRRIVLYMRYKP